MTPRFTNTLSREKEEFKPLKQGEVSLYACGITVYGETHVGHARGALVFDVLRRFLESRGFRVTHVRNITDVDDKLIERARREPGPGDLKAKVGDVARRYTQQFQADFNALGLLKPTREPKATEFIPKMVEFIERLVRRGMAYETADGVYFSVRKDPEYGRLSHQKPDQMMENHRAETGQGKKDALDFALWKKAKPDEPSWPSPWGEGRPGWHIECSTMSTDILGDTFDIHGGGQDLIFPHHENELTQALGAGKPFARVWLHNGLLTINGQKMAKSLGNFVTVADVLAKVPADVLRLFYLSAHYRSPIDFTWERMEEAKHATERLATFLAHCEAASDGAASGNPSDLERRFFEDLEDDLNTPKALAVLFEAVPHPGRQMGETVRRLGRILGLFQSGGTVDSGAEKLAKERDAARAKKDFAASDRIRKQLTDMGYAVEDTAGGTVIRKKL